MTRTGIRRGRRLGRGGHGKRRVFRLLSRPPGWMVFFFGCTYYFFFFFISSLFGDLDSQAAYTCCISVFIAVIDFLLIKNCKEKVASWNW